MTLKGIPNREIELPDSSEMHYKSVLMNTIAGCAATPVKPKVKGFEACMIRREWKMTSENDL
jgi:hypothetical protein